MRPRARWLAPVLLAASVLAVAVAVVHATSVVGSGRSTRPTAPTKAAVVARTRLHRRQTRPSASLPRMLGQMIVARVSGTTPSASLIARVKRGEVGGVILFADNFGLGVPAAHAMIAELQRAASAGGNPPLLVMTDQEGGEVNRVPGPPTLAPSEMTSPAIAFAQGQAAGRLLLSVGINVDLAPVADVERVSGSFLATRSFGSAPSVVAADACAFAHGLASEQVLYTLKHFPGLGRASANTDVASVVVAASADLIRADYAPYRACARGPSAIVMVSSASYPSLTGPLPAVMSRLTYERELPSATDGAPVVTISDDLQSTAINGQDTPARHAVDAGLDLLMYARTEQASDAAYGTLLGEARSGTLSRMRIQNAYDAVLGLKRRVAR